MGSATAHPSSRARQPAGARLAAALVAAAALGWVLTSAQMAGMGSGPATELGGLAAFTLVWVTMMVAMMLPPLAPIVAAYAGTHQSGSARRRAHASAAFVLGYLIPWFAVGVVIYAIVEGVRSLHLGALSWGQAGPYLAGGVILGAALYQLTTVKDVALRHCRDLSTLLGRARLGFFGALRTGIDHGVVCVSCCWAMMAALFALGMMSIGWMVFIAVLIAAEKLLPSQAVAKRGVAVLLALLAIAVAFVPDKVPGLMPPGSMEMSSTAEAPR